MLPFCPCAAAAIGSARMARTATNQAIRLIVSSLISLEAGASSSENRTSNAEHRTNRRTPDAARGGRTGRRRTTATPNWPRNETDEQITRPASAAHAVPEDRGYKCLSYNNLQATARQQDPPDPDAYEYLDPTSWIRPSFRPIGGGDTLSLSRRSGTGRNRHRPGVPAPAKGSGDHARTATRVTGGPLQGGNRPPPHPAPPPGGASRPAASRERLPRPLPRAGPRRPRPAQLPFHHRRHAARAQAALPHDRHPAPRRGRRRPQRGADPARDRRQPARSS